MENTKPIVSVDIETAGLDLQAEIACVQFYFPETDKFEFYPLNMIGVSTDDALNSLNLIRDVLESHRLVGHNLAFDITRLKRIYPDLDFEVYGDSYLFSLMTQQEKNGLKDLIVNMKLTTSDKVLPLENVAPDKDFTQLSILDSSAIQYAYQDVYFAWLLEKKFREIYPKYIPTYETECTYIPMFADMTLSGMRVDKDKFIEFRDKYAAETEEMRKKLCLEAQFDFKIRSSKDMAQVFANLEIPDPPLKTPKGAISYSSESLSYLSYHPFIGTLLDYNHRYSVVNSLANVDKWFNKIRDDFYLNPVYKHVGYDGTSRVYTEPSVQSLPKEFREFILPNPGKKFLFFDWAAAELMLMAYWAKEQWIIDLYESGHDLHREISSRLLNIPVSEVTKDKREISKIVTFSVAYGSEGGAAAKALKIPIEDATRLVEKFWHLCPKIQELREKMISASKKYGGTYTISGRYRRLPKLFSPDLSEQSAAIRQVFNTSIQGCLHGDMRIYDKKPD